MGSIYANSFNNSNSKSLRSSYFLSDITRLVYRWQQVRKIVAAVEDDLRKVGRSEADLARMNIVGILNQSEPPNKNMSGEKIKAMKDLSRDSSIVTLPADTGKSTVILNISECDENIKTMVSDHKTYKISVILHLHGKTNEYVVIIIKKSASIPKALL